MNKNAKGAIAVGAAVILLLGGSGTLAVWNASETVDGGTISAGQLALGGTPVGAWYQYSATGADDCAWYDANGTELDSGYKLVPGDDVIYCVAGLTLSAEGGNLYFIAEGGEGAFTVLDENDDEVLPGTYGPLGIVGTASVVAENEDAIDEITVANDGDYTGTLTGDTVYHVITSDGVAEFPVSASLRVQLPTTLTGTQAQQWSFELGDDSSVNFTQVIAVP